MENIEHYEILQGQISLFVKNLAVKEILPFSVSKTEEVYGGGYNLIIAKKYSIEALNFCKLNNIKKY